VIESQPCRIYWLKVTAQEREDYYHESKNLLDQLQLPTEAIHCQHFNCKDENIWKKFKICMQSCPILGMLLLPLQFITTGKKKADKFNIPGWNSVVKTKH